MLDLHLDIYKKVEYNIITENKSNIFFKAEGQKNDETDIRKIPTCRVALKYHIYDFIVTRNNRFVKQKRGGSKNDIKS